MVLEEKDMSLSKFDLEHDRERARMLARGEIPDNRELQSIIENSIQQVTKVERTGTLSPTGHQISADVREFLRSIKQVIIEKNDREHLQTMIRAVKQATFASEDALGPELKQRFADETRTLLEDMMSVIQAMISSSDYRRSLRELNERILQSLGSGFEGPLKVIQPKAEILTASESDVVSNLDSSGRKSSSRKRYSSPKHLDKLEEKIQQSGPKGVAPITQSSSQGRNLESRYGEIQSNAEAEDREAGLEKAKYHEPSASGERVEDPGQNVEICLEPRAIQSEISMVIERPEGQIKIETKKSSKDKDEVVPGVSEKQGPVKQALENERMTSPVHQLEAFEKNQEKIRQEHHLREEIIRPLENTEHTRSDMKIVVVDHLQDFLLRQLSEEQLEELADDLQYTFQEINSSNYISSNIKALLHVGDLVKDPLEGDMGVYIREIEEHKQVAKTEAQALLENFAGGYSLKNLKRAIDEFERLTKENDSLARDGNALRFFINRSIGDFRFVSRDAWKDDAIHHIVRVRRHLYQYRPAVFRVVQEIDAFLTNLRQDENITRLSKSSRNLSRHLFYDEVGDLEFKPEALDQLRKILVPVIKQHLNFVALSPLRGTYGDSEYEIRNLVMDSSSIMPDSILLTTSQNYRLKDFERGEAKEDRQIYLCIEGIGLNAEDVKISVKPKDASEWKNQGKMDIQVPKGMMMEVWLINELSPDHCFKVDRVQCRMKSLTVKDLRLSQKRPFLYSIRHPFVKGNLKKKLQFAIEEATRKLLVRLDDILTKVNS